MREKVLCSDASSAAKPRAGRRCKYLQLLQHHREPDEDAPVQGAEDGGAGKRILQNESNV